MSKRILVIDDAMFMRTMLKGILSRNGYEIAGEASNGIEGVDKFRQLSPDLVTLDITMPEMDGLQCLEKIMKTDPHAKVIMCSAMGQQTMVLDAIKLGAKDFIVKPFLEEKVIESVKNIIG